MDLKYNHKLQKNNNSFINHIVSNDYTSKKNQE